MKRPDIPCFYCEKPGGLCKQSCDRWKSYESEYAEFDQSRKDAYRKSGLTFTQSALAYTRSRSYKQRKFGTK